MILSVDRQQQKNYYYNIKYSLRTHKRTLRNSMTSNNTTILNLYFIIYAVLLLLSHVVVVNIHVHAFQSLISKRTQLASSSSSSVISYHQQCFLFPSIIKTRNHETRWKYYKEAEKPSSYDNRSYSLLPSSLRRRGSRGKDRTKQYVLTTPTESAIEQQTSVIPIFILDDLIDESVRYQARKPIIIQFNANGRMNHNKNQRQYSLWKYWKGTVFALMWDSIIYKMIYSAVVYIMLNTISNTVFVGGMTIQIKNANDLKSSLYGLDIIYGQLLLPITTFTLTFFVDQAYQKWRKCLELSRQLQGRLHDISLLLAAHAAREGGVPISSPSSDTTSTNSAKNSTTTSSTNTNQYEYSTYTKASKQLLQLISRYVRLFNLLSYASLTRSHRPIVTPRGMRRLVERKLMTELERDILISADIPATQRHTAVLLWIFRTYIEGCQHGHFVSSASQESHNHYNNNNNNNKSQYIDSIGMSLEQQFIDLMLVCRGSGGAIGSTLHGRMPLSYVHIVQVLVDLVSSSIFQINVEIIEEGKIQMKRQQKNYHIIPLQSLTRKSLSNYR